MPSLSRHLEQALHRAIKLASDRHHEYATLEHLLLALLDDPDAAQVLKACNVNVDPLRAALQKYVDEELMTLVIEDGEDAKPTTGFQRVVQRAVLHVQNSGRDEVTGGERSRRAVYRARESRRLFPARAEHDAARRGQLHQPRHCQAPRHESAKARERRRRRGRG
ncbi:MAG: Clp protease N-terminal domain-containing protein [Rhizomicrobium sp.]